MQTPEPRPDYPTCAETFATLRISGPGAEPLPVGMRPTRGGRQQGWLLSSRDAVESRDTEDHIRWLLDRSEPHAERVAELIAEGFAIDIFCFWLSAAGQGGPRLLPATMGRLAQLDLEVGFDIYFRDDEPDSAVAGVGRQP